MRGVKVLADQSRLKKLAEKAIKILKVSGEPEVFIVGSTEMRRLKHKYLGQDKDTNVLAFPYPHDFPQLPGKRRLGEIYLSPNYIERHKENIDFMLIHGLLHLVGYNHEEKSDRIWMERIEDKIIKDLKIKLE